MSHIRVNGKRTFQGKLENKIMTMDGERMDWSCQYLSSGQFSILVDGKSWLAALVKEDRINQVWLIRIHGQDYEIELESPLDELLKSMGVEGKKGTKDGYIRAPMPGRVLKILVNPGQEIQQGDALLILEAMKMENNCKSSLTGRIKEIKVSAGMAVEKGQVLAVMEPTL
ncbi:MAG: acyl-CoA carboxylase biotin carboxyl carrier protein subunit [Chitinophagaceae bacterium]